MPGELSEGDMYLQKLVDAQKEVEKERESVQGLKAAAADNEKLKARTEHSCGIMA